MNKHILNTEIQNFIYNNLNSDIAAILFKGTNFEHVSTHKIIEQIEAKKRCEKKLPTWFQTENIYYPNKLNIEQSSSEVTANLKSELMEGEGIIDITGGFGVDSFYFSKRFKKVVHCEMSKNLSEIAAHNYRQLNTENIETHASDGLEFLSNGNRFFDWIYADPSRRHDSKGKVFFLRDCLPNIPENLKLLFNCSKNVMLKTSPLLDITVGINELKFVKTIHVIAVNNEVKELLWVLEKGFVGNIAIETVNLKRTTQENFSFILEGEKQATANYSAPLTYLYEPNAAILKSGAFNEISKQFKVHKLHQHSHLYTSTSHIDFPGRVFKIEHIITYNKKEIKKLGIKKANVTTRNFPENVQQIRKKFGIADGGATYMFFTTEMNNDKIVLIVKKV